MAGDKSRGRYKNIWIVPFLICAMSCMAGCAGEEFMYREEALARTGNERKLSLEELERWAERGIGSADESKGDWEDGLEEGSGEGALEGESGREETELLPGGSFLREDCGSYAYSTLSEHEKLWYRDMALAMGSMTDRVKLSRNGIQAGLDESAVDKIFQSVLCDHPELFYVEGYSYTKYTRGEQTVAIEFTGTYSMDWDAALERKQEIERAVEELIRSAPDTDDDYEKVKYVYETLILQTDYDMTSRENQNIYSVFVGHASVCQGYAKAFQYLLNRLGLECALVQGKVRETGEGHAWNLVKADGDFYYVDATWGDISYQSSERRAGMESEETLPQISYDYLCITTEQLSRTHVLDGTTRMPECVAAADNYYVREGALFLDYDREQLAELVERRLSQGSTDISLRCADAECFRAMCEALVDGQEIFDYLTGTGINSFVYTSNDRQYTLTFFMVTSTR